MIKLFIGEVIIYFIKLKIISIFKASLLITSKALYIIIISIGYNSILFSILFLSKFSN